MAGNEQNLTPTEMINKGNDQYSLSQFNSAMGYVAGLGSTFSSLAGSLINYGALRTDAASLYVQAGEVQVQAKQRANQLREQFINATGSYMLGAAQRGIAVQSGSVKSNIERSAENLGKDIDTMQRNADMKSLALSTQANIAKKKASSMMRAGYANAVAGVAQNVSGIFGSYGAK